MSKLARQDLACAPTRPVPEGHSPKRLEADVIPPNPRQLILVVDDDPAVLKLLKRSLELEGYDVATATDGKTGLQLIEDIEPALVILDVMMPGLDGFQVCERARRFMNIPIIMLTVRGRLDEVVHGLEIGADDYLTKPFNLDELVARVRTILRRASQQNRTVALTPTEFRVLCPLVVNAGKVLTQQQLMTNVWGPKANNNTHVVRTTISRLRKKLGDNPHDPKFIATRAGVGYVFREPLQQSNRTALTASAGLRPVI
ncbi:MAG: response regulator transcription factor [Chloroflexi bacterium]|nr:response regulator transcription factor [Chloroflexota bacterium]